MEERPHAHALWALCPDKGKIRTLKVAKARFTAALLVPLPVWRPSAMSVTLKRYPLGKARHGKP
jgi:hypothetical protein